MSPENRRVRLSVNIDHVATLRQARRAAYPDPVEAARAAEAAGATGITVHLRSDRRHVQDDDVARLRDAVAGKLNLEMAPTDEMVAIAERLRPHQVSLVPERPDEVTTEGGLDLTTQAPRVETAAVRLAAAGVAVSIFLDPEPRQVEALAALAHRGLETGARVVGFEINTDAYTRAEGAGRDAELERARRVAALGHQTRLRRLRRPRPDHRQRRPHRRPPRGRGAQHRPLARLPRRDRSACRRRCARCWRRWRRPEALGRPDRSPPAGIAEFVQSTPVGSGGLVRPSYLGDDRFVHLAGSRAAQRKSVVPSYQVEHRGHEEVQQSERSPR